MGFLFLIKILPLNILSRMSGRIARWTAPIGLIRAMQNWFIKKYKLRMDEAELPLSEYKTVNSLFTRRLKSGVRPIAAGLVHPVDAFINASGTMENSKLLQVKGRHYSVQDLTRTSDSKWNGGNFITYYLCPTDYHRVHSPFDGVLKSVQYIPGYLFPVNKPSVRLVGDLFCLNERLVFHFDSSAGPFIMVMVGATNVGHMTISVDPSVQTNMGDSSGWTRSYNTPVKKGDEVGIFHLGSTVILLLSAEWNKCQVSAPPLNVQVRLGESNRSFDVK